MKRDSPWVRSAIRPSNADSLALARTVARMLSEAAAMMMTQGGCLRTQGLGGAERGQCRDDEQ